MTVDLDNNSDPYAILQQLLDILSSEPGAIIYRGPEMWEPLLPANVGDTLILGPDGLPIWSGNP